MQHTHDHQNKLAQLIQQRRTTTHADSTDLANISKLVLKEVKARRQMTRRAKIEQILEQYIGLK